MGRRDLLTTVIGSYPFPGWLEYASSTSMNSARPTSKRCGTTLSSPRSTTRSPPDSTSSPMASRPATISICLSTDVLKASASSRSRRAVSARPRTISAARRGHRPIRSAHGLGAVEEFRRLLRIAGTAGPVLKASVPGPYTLSGRIDCPATAGRYTERALLPLVQRELEDLVAAGCAEITLDEPSMSCYAHREEPRRFVEIFNGPSSRWSGAAAFAPTCASAITRPAPSGPRRYAPMFPAFLDFPVDEMHVEMASREFAELELIARIAEHGWTLRSASST